MNQIFTRVRRIVCSVIFSLFFLQSSSQPNLTYTTYLSGFTLPVDLVNANDNTNRLFIVEQGGLIKVANGTTVNTFMDLTAFVPFSVLNDERGVLSLAFHPNFDGINNRFFFVYYTTTTGGVTTIRVARYETVVGNSNLGNASSGQEVIAIAKPAGRTNHNGGKLNFGSDGMLYFGTGDGGGSYDPDNLAQNGNSLLGKMIRIDINGTSGPTGLYSIPPDNPYLSPGDGIRDEIWAIGLRNPYRWSFDSQNDNMWIADVGQATREEINRVVANPTTGGVNYGWRCYEGNLEPTPTLPSCNPLPSNYVAPVFDYTHNMGTGGFSVTGGYVYRGTLSPHLYGYYVFADYVSGNVWVMTPDLNVTQQQNDIANVSGFGVDESGELYALSRSGGSIISIAGAFALPVSLVSFTGKSLQGYNELMWSTAFEQAADKYIIEYSTDGVNFSVAGQVLATNNPNGSGYSFRHPTTLAGKVYYRLLMQDANTNSKYSAIIVLGNKNAGSIKVYPTLIQNDKVDINSSAALDQLTVFDTGGRQVYQTRLNGREGFFSVTLPSLSKGVYYLTLRGPELTKTEKIVVQ